MTEPVAPPVAGTPGAPKKKMGVLTRILLAGAVLGALVGAALAMIFAMFTVPSGSMWPGIAKGDRILMSRLTKQPVRGGIFVCRYPEHRASMLAKRVVGLAGDVVSMEGGELAINGWKVPRCVVGKASYGDGEGRHEGTLVLEHLGASRYLVFEEKTAFAETVNGSWTVAPGQSFVLGDNRNSSHDSRLWYGGAGGGVPEDDTVGLVVGHDDVALPKGAEDLAPALAACLDKRPDQTDPPAPAPAK